MGGAQAPAGRRGRALESLGCRPGPVVTASSRYAVLGEDPEHRSSTGPVPRREDGLEDQLLRATLVSAEMARPAYRSSPEDQVVLAPEFVGSRLLLVLLGCQI